MKLSKEEQSHLRGIANGPVFGRRSGDKEGGKGWANGGGRLIGNGEGTGVEGGLLAQAAVFIPRSPRARDRGHPPFSGRCDFLTPTRLKTSLGG